jgi:threonine dehydratase
VVTELKPDVRLIGVQAAGAAAYPPSLAAGVPVALTSMSTIADGIAVGCPGELTFAHVRSYCDEMVTVTEEDISRALLFCLERAKLVVEPAGAVGVGAVLADPHRFEPPVVVVLSGGNIDPLLLHRVIEHGLAAAGRYLHFTVEFADRPGSLAGLLTLLAEQGVNVLDVEHIRHDARLRLGEVEVKLSVETKGNEHSQQLLTALRRASYRVKFS